MIKKINLFKFYLAILKLPSWHNHTPRPLHLIEWSKNKIKRLHKSQKKKKKQRIFTVYDLRCDSSETGVSANDRTLPQP